MSILKKAETNEQAFLKGGILGFSGSGKTFTASMLAIALAKRASKPKPVAFFDTETGSDYLLPKFAVEGIEVLRVKSYSYTDLLAAAREAESSCSVLVVDSITHVWRCLCESYQKRRNISKLQFQHWNDIKREWGEWTTLYLNCRLHIIVCGRAGYEYDFQDDDGKKELIKIGTKMKVESEFGYEPSLLIEMERAERSAKPGAGWIHRAHVLKDRTDTINGAAFDFTRTKTGYKKGGYQLVEKAFAPALAALNPEGEHIGVDATRTDEQRFSGPGGVPQWKYEEEQKAIALDEIAELLKKHWPSQNGDDKEARAACLERAAGTRSWKKVEAYDWATVRALRDQLWLDLEHKTYGVTPKLSSVVESAQQDELEFA
jgi:hypothetical protein